MKTRALISGILALTAAISSAAVLTGCGDKNNSMKLSDIIVGTSSASQGSSGASQQQSGGESSAASHDDSGNRGFVTVDGVSYYYNADGELQTGGIVGSDADGYYYADESGVIDTGYCNAVSFEGEDWNVIDGKATKVETESDRTLFYALEAVSQYTDSSMTREQKLRVCFDHLKEDYLEGVRHDPPYNEMDWPVIYANDIFVYGKGDCFSYGAAFAYMAKAIGYTESYACNSGGHGWAEIDGLFYDPEWDMHHNEYNHYGVAPDDPNDVDYSGGIAPGAEWMHVKV